MTATALGANWTAGPARLMAHSSLTQAPQNRPQMTNLAPYDYAKLLLLAVGVSLSSCNATASRKDSPQTLASTVNSKPEMDKCGHPVKRDSLGASIGDPVCELISNKKQPLIDLPNECNQGVVSYDVHCTMARAAFALSGPPAPLF
jgi:hypothetical protein